MFRPSRPLRIKEGQVVQVGCLANAIHSMRLLKDAYGKAVSLAVCTHFRPFLELEIAMAPHMPSLALDPQRLGTH